MYSFQENMYSFQEDIIELRNFKAKYKLKKMVVHFHEANLYNGDCWIYMAYFMEKLINGCILSYIIYDDDFERDLFPLVTKESIYLIELENDGSDSLKQIEYYKKRVLEIKGKLSSKFFLDKAPAHIIEIERKRLLDFEKRWELASLGYMFV